MPTLDAASRQSPPRAPILGTGFLVAIGLLIFACAVLFAAASYVIGTLIRAHIG